MEGQTPILDVPNEILLKIFGHLSDDGTKPYSVAWPLALTCKRFFVLAQPVVWSHISLESNDHEEEIERSWVTIGFNRRLRSRKTRKGLESASAATTSCVKHVSLHGAGETEIGFRDAIELMQRYPNLRRLDLDGICNVTRIWDDSPARGQRFIREAAEVVSPPPGLEGTSNLEELHLGRFKFGTPDALRSFLQWPARLRVFTIDELAHCDKDWDYLLEWENCCRWTYQMVPDILSGHAKTLRFLRIRQMGPETLEIFNVNNFTALETLEVCAGSVLPTPQVAYQSWALRNLKRLVMNCSQCCSMLGVRPIYNEEMVEWIRQFAALVVRRKARDRVALQHVEILSFTDHDPRDGLPCEEKEGLETLKQYIEECGLEASITYTNRYPSID